MATALVGTALTLSTSSTNAAVTATLTVDSLDYVGDDANPGDGTCATATNICTLRAAIQEANALNPGAGDEVQINFDDGLSGFIVGPHSGTAANRMKTGVIVPGWSHDGAYYHITSRVNIDFGDDVGFTPYGDSWADAFLVDGPDVTIRNFTAVATNPPGTAGNRTIQGLSGSESTITVTGNGDGFTLENGILAETGTNWNERGILILDGADDVTIRNVTFDDFQDWGGAIRILEDATISNLLLDGVVMNNTSSESNYYGLFVERDATLNNFRTINSEFNNWQGSRIFSMDRTTINGGAFDNNVVDTITRNRTRWLFTFDQANLSNFTFNDNLFNKLGVDRILDFYRTTMTNVTVDGNTFQDNRNVSPTNATMLNVIEGRHSESSNVAITNNTFSNMEIVGGWRVMDFRSGQAVNMNVSNNSFTNLDVSGVVLDLADTPVSGLAFLGNTFDDVDANDGFVDLRNSTSSNVEIANNTFQETSSFWPAIWTNRVSVNSTIHHNSWVNASATKEHGWIYNYDTGGTPATTDTGWRFRDNHIAVAPRSNEAPVQIESGHLPVERNTFAAPSRGTTVTDDALALSETGVSWFVRNYGSANGKFRTWYPNAVEIDGAAGRARVTVQPPTASETPIPAPPVAVDVYYTPSAGGERQADVYLGRIQGLTAQSTFEINCPGCTAGGFIRVQTILSNGATTQYSRVFEGVAGSVPAAGLGVDLEDGDEVPVGSTITGTGTPGNSIEVINETNGETLCTTTVPESGNWSCEVDFDVTQGDASIKVIETAPDTTPVDETTPVDVDIVPAPVILGVSDGEQIEVGSEVTGSGTPGTTIIVENVGTGDPLCTTTVAPDGTWSCNVAFDADQGPATIVAREVGGPSSDLVDVDIVPAPVTLDVGDGSDVPVGSTIGGTGNPGAEVTVRNTTNGDVLCTATVQADGTWSCVVDDTTTVGAATLVATETGGGSSAPVPANIVPAAVIPGSAVNDSENFVLDTPYTFDPLANDTDPTNASFDPTTVQLIDPDTGNPETTVVVPGEGTFEVDPATGEITFTPEPGFTGPTNPLNYTVEDTEGNLYQATVVLTAAPVVGVSMFGPGAIGGAVIAAGGLALIAARRRRNLTV